MGGWVDGSVKAPVDSGRDGWLSSFESGRLRASPVDWLCVLTWSSWQICRRSGAAAGPAAVAEGGEDSQRTQQYRISRHRHRPIMSNASHHNTPPITIRLGDGLGRASDRTHPTYHLGARGLAEHLVVLVHNIHLKRWGGLRSAGVSHMGNGSLWSHRLVVCRNEELSAQSIHRTGSCYIPTN